jgi:hypothetical protein
LAPIADISTTFCRCLRACLLDQRPQQFVLPGEARRREQEGALNAIERSGNAVAARQIKMHGVRLSGGPAGGP